VVSDHGHSLVAGDPAFFPLRAIGDGPDGGAGVMGGVEPNGYAVSGDVRTADLLARAGFAHVYDGVGCTNDPVLSGLKPDGTQLYPTQTDGDGTVCGKAGASYNTASFKVPATVPADAIIIAANGCSCAKRRRGPTGRASAGRPRGARRWSSARKARREPGSTDSSWTGWSTRHGLRRTTGACMAIRARVVCRSSAATAIAIRTMPSTSTSTSMTM
jgi:hypothetical protein